MDASLSDSNHRAWHPIGDGGDLAPPVNRSSSAPSSRWRGGHGAKRTAQ